MNSIAKEIESYYGWSKSADVDYLAHQGVGHLDGGHSGRYPWGSGEDPYQHSVDFLDRVNELKKSGWKPTPENIKKSFNMSYTDFRRETSLCNDARKAGQIARAENLKEKYNGNTSAIARAMNVSEATVRGWFKQENDARYKITKNTMDFLKKQVDDKKMIDVGKGTEAVLGVSRDKLDTALYGLESSGYHVYGGGIPQPTNKKQQTNQLVLAAPEVKSNEIYDYSKVKSIEEYHSSNNGETFHKKFTYPASLDSKRLRIRYREDGGQQKDGIIELRRGVPDLDLQGAKYSQVRILVDGTHYLKGVAIYSDDMPKGVDVVFNTNKSKSKSMKEVLKPIKNDKENPFGSNIKDADQGGQYWYTGKDGKEHLGLINKTRSEGDWTEWKDSLPSQFLSKQSLMLASKQLKLAEATSKAEYDDIMSLKNPTLKKYYLKEFSDNCDKAAQDLKAAALPGQKYHVIIPINTLKDTEIYAPQYKSGTKLALIRYPHAGTFEIPVLTVNNKNQLGSKVIGPTSIDAVGITSKVASQLSGADFDGDTVMCIPTDDKNGKVHIARRKPLEALQNFDPELEYGATKVYTKKNGKEYGVRGNREFPIMSESYKQKQMGIISNLITDMTLSGGATDDELACAVKHSMVVIDAVKHKYDYKLSEQQNHIDDLKKKYQPKYDSAGNLVGYGGAGTIISRAKGEQDVPITRGQAYINIKGKKNYDPTRPEGALIYKEETDPSKKYYVEGTYNKKTGIKTLKTTTGNTISYQVGDEKERLKYNPVLQIDPKTGEGYYTNPAGNIKYRTKTRTKKSTRMAETDDARSLMSSTTHPHSMEVLYADYANYMKDLGNKARLSYSQTKNLEYKPEAKKKYAAEVKSLDEKINKAKLNAPKERAVMRLANTQIKERKISNPDMTAEDERKLGQRYLSKYREQLGSVSRRNRYMPITDKEWEAIQSGAISNDKMLTILRNTDPDELRERAMPKEHKTLSAAQVGRIKAMANSNFTLEQIATKMHISTATVSKYLKGVE